MPPCTANLSANDHLMQREHDTGRCYYYPGLRVGEPSRIILPRLARVARGMVPDSLAPRTTAVTYRLFISPNVRKGSNAADGDVVIERRKGC